MAYSNGRIYVDTSVTPNVGVSINDLQRCFAVVIEATINGQTVRLLSGDLGVYCSKKTGDTFSAPYTYNNNGTLVTVNATWRVISRREINPWARYRPIPCSLFPASDNIPQTITPTQRMNERYGLDQLVDMYAADPDQLYVDYVNSLEKKGTYYLKVRLWGDTHWKRLTDFAKTDDNGNVTSLGYDHNARMDDVTVKLRGDNNLYTLTPLIPEGNRELYIPDGETVRFQFPNDQKWVNEYYKYMRGVLSNVETVNNHEEWLSAMDLMVSNQYSNNNIPQDITQVLRGVSIFRRANDAWELLNVVYNRVGNSNYSTEYNSTTKESFLDLTRLNDGGMNNIDLYMFNHPELDTDTNARDRVSLYRVDTAHQNMYPYHHDFMLWNLEGRLLFSEFWVQDNSFQNLMPIPGFTYEVNIHRQAAPPVPAQNHAYITNVLGFQTQDMGNAVQIALQDNPSWTSIVFTFIINPSTFLQSGESLGNDVIANAALVMTRMRDAYSAFNLIISDSQGNEVFNFNLLTEIMEIGYSNYDVGGEIWKECDSLLYDASGHVSTSGLTAKVVATTRSQYGGTRGSDQLGIENT